MTEWKVVGPDARYIPLIKLVTIWGYWPDDDAVELYGALDEYTEENNYEHYVSMLTDARKQYGPENVRVAYVKVPWTPIHEMFEPAQVEADLPVAAPTEPTAAHEEGT